MKTSAIAALALSLSACAQPAAVHPLRAQLSQSVTLEGVARDAKLGAFLQLDHGGAVWIDGLHAFPPAVRGKRLRVTGTLIERSDLPVLVERPGEPHMQGIPVPAGTDVEKARQRLLLRGATWIESP